MRCQTSADNSTRGSRSTAWKWVLVQFGASEVVLLNVGPHKYGTGSRGTGSRYDTHNGRTRKEICNQPYPVATAPGSVFVWRRRLLFCSLDLWATLARTKLNQYPEVVDRLRFFAVSYSLPVPCRTNQELRKGAKSSQRGARRSACPSQNLPARINIPMTMNATAAMRLIHRSGR